MSFTSIARKFSAALAVSILLSSTSFGALLAPGGGVLTPISAPPVGAVIVPGVPVPFTGPGPNGFSGTLSTTVIQENAAANPLLGLTFIYQLHNNANSATALERLVTTDFGSFGGWATDVSYAPTGQAPTVTDRSINAGSVIGWDFTGPPLGLGTLAPGLTSGELIVRTNAPGYDLTQQASVIDGSTVAVGAAGPSPTNISPEPGSISIIAIAAMGLGRLGRRKHD